MLKNLALFNSIDLSDHFYNSYFLKTDFNTNSENYLKYKNGIFNDLEKEKLDRFEVLRVLESLGFSPNKIGTYFYVDMVAKTMQWSKGLDSFGSSLSRDDLLQQLKNPYSNFYVDVARNDLDIGIKTFHSHVIDTIKHINWDTTDTDLLEQIGGDFDSYVDYGEFALLVGEYVNTSYEFEDDKKNKINIKNFIQVTQ